MAQLRCASAFCTAFLFLGLCGCGGGHADDIRDVICTASVDPGIVVYVTDAATGAPDVTGTTVTITDGDYTETLAPIASTGGDFPISLAVGGAYERPGTYTVTVTHSGDATVEKTVTVNKGVCHVDTQTIHVALTAE